MKRTWIVLAAIVAALVSANVSAQEPRPVQRVLLENTERVPLSGFSVVLVAGSETGETTAGNLPASAAKALADMKDFLPYKSYQLLDTQWTASSIAGEVRSRLRGLDGVEYALSVQYTSSPRGSTSIGSFTLRAGNGRTADARAVEMQVRELAARRAMLAAQRDAARANDPDPTSRARANAVESEIRHVETARAQAERQLGTASRAEDPIINTRFNMDVGETVVVGTSRLQGDKALIVLLTAVGRK